MNENDYISAKTNLMRVKKKFYAWPTINNKMNKKMQSSTLLTYYNGVKRIPFIVKATCGYIIVKSKLKTQTRTLIFIFIRKLMTL